MKEYKEQELKKCCGLYPILVTDDKNFPFQFKCKLCDREGEKCINGLAAGISWNEPNEDN